MDNQIKFYVATSWRNEEPFARVVKFLEDQGHEVYNFKTDNNFHWSDIDPGYKMWNNKGYLEALKSEVALSGFISDMNALTNCDVCVMVLPCGASAHTELGYAVGYGKKTIIILDDTQRDNPELMYKMVDHIFESETNFYEYMLRVSVIRENDNKKQSLQSHKTQD